MSAESKPQPSFSRKVFLSILRIIGLTICLGWVFLTVGLWLFQEKLVFPANPNPPRNNPAQSNIPFEQYQVQTADGEKLDVWWMPLEGGTPIFFATAMPVTSKTECLFFSTCIKPGFRYLHSTTAATAVPPVNRAKRASTKMLMRCGNLPSTIWA